MRSRYLSEWSGHFRTETSEIWFLKTSPHQSLRRRCWRHSSLRSPPTLAFLRPLGNASWSSMTFELNYTSIREQKVRIRLPEDRAPGSRRQDLGPCDQHGGWREAAAEAGAEPRRAGGAARDRGVPLQTGGLPRLQEAASTRANSVVTSATCFHLPCLN